MDLFGLPLPEVRGRGRPAHVWTQENSNKVSLLFACGRGVTEVAHAIGITEPTFRKHYFNEISRAKLAPIMLKAEQLARLNAAAKAGNVAAEKALAGMVQAEQMRAQAARFGDEPKKAKAAPKGVKAEREERAWLAGKGDEDWGDLLHGETGAALPN